MRLILSNRERQLIQSTDLCRLSTISPNGWPHTVSTSYLYLRGAFFIPSKEKTKKVRNIEKNRRSTILIDDKSRESGVMLECRSEIVVDARAERLREYMRSVKHWQNDEHTVIIKLTAVRKASWFET